MDGTSPGCLPTTLGGQVWVGEVRTTAANPTPFEYPLTTEPMNGTIAVGGGNVCGGGIRPTGWTRLDREQGGEVGAGQTIVKMAAGPLAQWPTPSISDADVERIARRAAEIVVEMLRGDVKP
jgi:hypothetical protein